MLTLEEWNRYHWWAETYVFQHYSEEHSQYMPYFNLFQFDDEQLEIAQQDEEFTTIDLYKSPEAPLDDTYCRKAEYFTYLLSEYFRDVFETDRFNKGFMASHRYNRIILPKGLYERVVKVFEEYNVLPIGDFIFEIIAIAQETYQESLIYEEQDFKRRAKDIYKEVKGLADVLKYLDYRFSASSPELKSIDFNFDSLTKEEKKRRITDPWLMRDILDQFKQYLETKLPFREWQKSLAHYPAIYNGVKQKLNFKYKFTAALYNLFTKEGFFKTLTPTPNNVINCITSILEFSLIPFKSKSDEYELSFNEKSGRVLTWVQRHLEDLQESLTHLNIPYDSDKLGKYFDEHFLTIGGAVKDAEILNIISYIIERFDIKESARDMAHVALCLRTYSNLVSFQLNSGNLGKGLSNDYLALRKFTEAIEQGKQIQDVKFKLVGDEKEYKFNERLPQYLLESAIRYYKAGNSEDFDNDILKGRVYATGIQGEYRAEYDGPLNLPEERFVVRFITSLYKYLSTEVPQLGKDTDKYYTIIAIMLQKVWFFKHQRDNEQVLISKVKRWHELAQPK